MGGHAAGEVASALAIQTLRQAIEAGGDLGEACRLANQQVHAQAQSDPGRKGMGTTLVTLLLEDGRFTVANVGDSRAYLVSADGVRQITHDHSFAAEAIRRGQSEEEARRSPFKDALTRSIGTEAKVEVDVFGPFPMASGTAVLLCSDGFYKTVGAGELRRVFTESTDAHDAARTLVSAAFDAGSDDNITVVVAESGRVPRTAPSTPERGSGAATLRMDPIEGPVAPSSLPEPEPAADPEDAGSGWKAAMRRFLGR